MSGRLITAVLLGVVLTGCALEPPASPPSGTGTPPPSTVPGSWSETARQELSILHDIVAGPAGFVAAGCATDADGDCRRALIVASPDGAGWSEVPLDRAGDASIRRVVVVRERLYALGYVIDDELAELRTVVWSSADGLEWSIEPTASFQSTFVNDILEWPGGSLAVGVHAPYASEGSGFVTWDVGPDGAFGEPRDIRPVAGPAIVYGAAWLGDGFLAWGDDGPFAGEAGRGTTLLASRDGAVWTTLPAIDVFAASTVLDVVRFGGSLVAVGYEGSSLPTTARAWISEDGLGWEGAAGPGGPGALYTIDQVAGRLVARGDDQSEEDARRPTSWVSPDGATWTRLAPGDDLPDLPDGGAMRRAMLGQRACAISTAFGIAGPRTVIYCR